MSEDRCAICDRPEPDRQQIEHEETGQQIGVCWECLRSRLRAKADASDERARELLDRDARRFDWNVWSTENVLYLLPPLDHEVEEEASDEEPVVDVAHG